ncbi:MAG TPA: hypothetical protein VH859_09085 [Candidatus Limnocylindria bacterium]|jgi:hypothetical protein
MTSVIGLRLAYRGFVTGLAAGYVWIATAMGLAALLHGDPLAPLRPLATLVLPAAGGSASISFVLGFGLVQLAAATVGMCFSYFFGRFFTARPTLAAAAPCFALLAWALFAAGAGWRSGDTDLGIAAAPVLATLVYGLLLGAGLPVRGEVLRDTQAGSPST